MSLATFAAAWGAGGLGAASTVYGQAEAFNRPVYVGATGGAWEIGANWLDQLNNPVAPGPTSNVLIGNGAVPILSGGGPILSLEIKPGSGLTLASGATLQIKGYTSGLPSPLPSGFSFFTPGGLITIQGSGGGGAKLDFSAADGIVPVFFNAGGTVAMTGSGAQVVGRIRNTNSMFRGSGQIGLGLYGVENGSDIRADLPGQTLTVSGGFVPGTGFGIINTGVMSALNGGNLVLTRGADLDNSGGSLVSDGAGSVVSFRNNLLVKGGTLSGSNGGIFRVDSGQTARISGVSLSQGTELQVASGATLYGSGGVLNNNGAIVIGAPGDAAAASLRPDNDAGGSLSIAGTGSVVLNSDSANIGPFFLGGTIYHRPGHTIRGFGNLTGGFIGFDNAAGATVSADVAGQTLRLRPSPGGITNAGLLEARNGGILRLSAEFGGQQGGGPVNQSASGVVRAVGAGSIVDLSDGVGIIGGSIATTGGGLFRIGNTAGSKYGYLTGVTSTTDIEVLPGANLGVFGTLVNNATITVRPSAVAGFGSQTQISMGESASFTGNGSVELRSDVGGAAIFNASGSAIFNGAGHTIRGNGGIFATGNFVNAGTVRADIPGGTFTVSVNSSVGGFQNSGVLEATNGGILSLGGLYTQVGGGVIRAVGAGSRVDIQSATFNRSVFGSSGGGKVRVFNNGTAQITDGTFNTDVDVEAARIWQFGDLTNNGVITLKPSPALAGVAGGIEYFTGVSTVTGTGSIVMMASAVGGAQLVNAFAFGGVQDGRLVNDTTHTIRGNGSILMKFYNKGLLHADQPGGGIYVGPAAVTNAITNDGTFRASAGGTLTVNRTPTNFVGGTLTGGSWQALSGGAIRFVGISITNNSASIVLDGPGSDLFANTSGSGSALAGLVTNAGQFEIRGGRNFTTAGALLNSGSLVVGENTTLTVPGTLTNSGKISGRGRIVAQRVRTPGRFAPGASPGTLTIQGNLDVETGAIYEWELSPTASDLVAVIGNLTFGSTATLEVLPFEGGLPPVSGADYTLFTATGTISALPSWTITLPPDWTSGGIEVRSNAVVLTNLAYVPEPGSLTGLAATGLLLARRRR